MKGLQWLIAALLIIVSISLFANATATVDKEYKANHSQHGHLIPARATRTIHNCYSASLQRKQLFLEKKNRKKHHGSSILQKYEPKKRSINDKTKIQTLYICSTTSTAKKSQSSTTVTTSTTKKHHRKHHKHHHKKSSAPSNHRKHHKHSSKKDHDDKINSGTRNSAGANKKHKHHTKLTVHHSKSLSVTKTNKKIHQTRETSSSTQSVEPTVFPSAVGYNNDNNKNENDNDHTFAQDKKQNTAVSSNSNTSSSSAAADYSNQEQNANGDNNSDTAQNESINDEDSNNDEEQKDETEEVSSSSVDLTSASLSSTSTASSASAPAPPVVDNNNQVTAQTVQNGQAIENEPHNKVVGVSVGAVVGCLAAAGLAGMFIYKRKQKSDQEQTSGGDGGIGGSSSRLSRGWMGGDGTAPVNTRWRTQSFLAVVAGAVAKLPNRSNSSSSTRSGGSFLGSIRRAASQASRSLSIRSSNSSLKRTSSGNSSVQSYGIAVSGPLPPIVRVDGDQAQYYAEPESPISHSSSSPHQQYNQVYHTHAY